MNCCSASRAGIPVHRNGDVDRTGVAGHQGPELGSTLVAQGCLGATCLYCREPVTFTAQGRVAHRVNTLVEAVDAAGLDTTLNAGPRQPASKQFGRGQDTVVASGVLGHKRIRTACERLVSHTDTKRSRAPKFAPSRALWPQLDADGVPLNSLPRLR